PVAPARTLYFVLSTCLNKAARLQPSRSCLMTRFLSKLVFTSLLAIAVLLTAADWPQWRGPNRDGVSKETGLLKQWPADGPKLLWQVKDLGDGYSTPSVVGNRLYVLGSKGMDDESVYALDVSDGRTVWTTRLGN